MRECAKLVDGREGGKESNCSDLSWQELQLSEWNAGMRRGLLVGSPEAPDSRVRQNAHVRDVLQNSSLCQHPVSCVEFLLTPRMQLKSDKQYLDSVGCDS